MIFDNYQKRQYVPIDGYHHLVGSRNARIIVRDDTGSNFKHPYYTHPSYIQSGESTSFMINNESRDQKHSTNRKSILVIRSVAQSSLGNETFIGSASIASKTATSNSHVQYEVARNGVYNHDATNILLNWKTGRGAESLRTEQDGHIKTTGRIFVYDKVESRHLWVPRGANTDIYADEESGGGSGGLSITQYWS